MKRVLKLIYLPLVVMCIIQRWFSSEVFWSIGMTLLLIDIILKKSGRFRVPFREYRILMFFVLWGGVIGAIGVVKGSILTTDFIRDIFYYMNPLIFLYLGATYYEKDIEISRLLNTFILVSGVISLASVVSIITNFSELLHAGSAYYWRSMLSGGSSATTISLVIVSTGIIPPKERLPKYLVVILSLFNAIMLAVSLSRTEILFFLIAYFIISMNKSNANKMIIRTLGIICSISIFVVILQRILPNDVYSSFLGKIISSIYEINVSHDWSNPFEVQSNWRGYETFMAVTQWQEANIFEQIFGSGFGRRIYVGNYAYTLLGQVTSNGNPTDSIPVLHNGYATQMIKLGVWGVIMYLAFYILLIKKGIRAYKQSKDIFARLLLALSVGFFVQTYYLNGLFKDYVFLPQIILIGYLSCKFNRRRKKNVR